MPTCAPRRWLHPFVSAHSWWLLKLSRAHILQNRSFKLDWGKRAKKAVLSKKAPLPCISRVRHDRPERRKRWTPRHAHGHAVACCIALLLHTCINTTKQLLQFLKTLFLHHADPNVKHTFSFHLLSSFPLLLRLHGRNLKKGNTAFLITVTQTKGGLVVVLSAQLPLPTPPPAAVCNLT